MKSFLFSLFMLISISLTAQITGKVQDTSGNPLAGATVSLLQAKDSLEIKLAVTNKDGYYEFAQTPAGTYLIAASFTGHQAAMSQPVTVSQNHTQVAHLQLTPLPAELAAVVITAKKPLIEVKADKMILNVEGTLQSTGTDALELLRKSPGVFIDKDERISMNGKNGVQVYIDGKPSPLTGQDLANYLKSIQSSQVASIELITNPSAKYEAAGNAGIINIRLKKNLSHGLNGTVQAGYNMARYGKFNSGVNLNYRNQNVNLFGNYSYGKATNENKLTIARSLADSLYHTNSLTTAKNDYHNFKAGADFFINKRNIIGVMVNGNLMDASLKSTGGTAVTAKSSKEQDNKSDADNQSDMSRDNITYNLNYQFNGNTGKSLSINADYGEYNSDSRQMQQTTFPVSPKPAQLNKILSSGDIAITAVKADWEQNLAKGRLGAGAKSSFANSDNDFRQYSLSGDASHLDPAMSNRFMYREQIHAGYLSYNRQFKGFMVQAGLRVENTITHGKSHGYDDRKDEHFDKNYTDLFPSATISMNKNPQKQLSASYSRRIDRPSYQQLNPFEFRIDAYTVAKGNIHLKPQYTNSFGLSYVYKYKLSAVLNYSHVNGMMASLTDTAQNKLVITSDNLGSQDVISLNLSYPFQYKKLSLFTNVSANYSKYSADFGAGREVDAEAFGLTAVMQGSLALGKDWTAQTTAFYNAPTIYQGNFRAESLWSVEAGIQRQLLDKRMTIKASVSDIFNSLKFNAKTDFAGQQTRLASNWESRQFKLSATWRFGRKEIKPARQRKTGADEEIDRAKSGGGGIGIGQ